MYIYMYDDVYLIRLQQEVLQNPISIRNYRYKQAQKLGYSTWIKPNFSPITGQLALFLQYPIFNTTYIGKCLCVCMYIYVHMYAYICIYVYLYIYVCVYICIYMYVYAYTCMYMHIQIYPYININITRNLSGLCYLYLHIIVCISCLCFLRMTPVQTFNSTRDLIRPGI
jgi:hypothetical protein